MLLARAQAPSPQGAASPKPSRRLLGKTLLRWGLGGADAFVPTLSSRPASASSPWPCVCFPGLPVDPQPG